MVNENNKELIIGIPRGMLYYGHYPFLHGFFTALGFKIVLSDFTTKQTISEGSALVVTETCLPIKVYIGHILNLLNKGVWEKGVIPNHTCKKAPVGVLFCAHGDFLVALFCRYLQAGRLVL